MPACVFDQIIAGKVPGQLVVDDEEIVAFLDNRPLFPGHTLIVPRTHVPTLAELTDRQATELWATGRRLAAAVRPALGAAGAFVALNDEVSQSVPHVHLHVVPRRFKDGLRGFFWPRTKYEDGQAETVAEALRSALA